MLLISNIVTIPKKRSLAIDQKVVVVVVVDVAVPVGLGDVVDLAYPQKEAP